MHSDTGRQTGASIQVITDGAETKAFHLGFGSTSYAVSLAGGPLLASLYWGPRLLSVPPDKERLDVSRVQGFPAGEPADIADYLTTVSTGEVRFSPDLLRREYPSWGTGELRNPAWIIRRPDGTRAGALEYEGHAVLHGDQASAERQTRADKQTSVDEKHQYPPRPRGLPWVYVDNPTTLRIDCRDPAGGVTISLFYTVIDTAPILLRWARVTNTGGEPLSLEGAASASVDLPAREVPLDLVTLNGAWARERALHRRPVAPGVQQVESRGGASGHQHAPFLALMEPSATEHQGRVWGMALLYSGNHRHLVEMDQYGVVRAQAGLNPFAFEWCLEPGASFDTPACALAFSTEGLNGLSGVLHRFVRDALIPPRWRDRDRPIVLNTWEAHYFAVDEEKVQDLARYGAEVGAELLVLDDGWFRGRNDDTSSLGDWTPDTSKFPRGLSAVAERVQARGLRFGIWVEPEMVNPHSDLYRAHPEWVIGIQGREHTLARNQLVLDLSNPEVVDYLADVFTTLLGSAPIDYVKWDMNRNMSEPGSPGLAASAQGEVMHRYILGLYRLLDTLTGRFPDVLFEGCAGGGGRFDYGMLHWTPQFWTSDQTDAIERLSIQRGTSVLFPPETMGAHVSASPNHLVGRVTPAWTRVVTALAFNFGFELDLARESEADLAIYLHGSALYREYRKLFRTGRFRRLLPDVEGPGAGRRSPQDSAWIVTDPDARRALVFHVGVSARVNRGAAYLPIAGLDPDVLYRVEVVAEGVRSFQEILVGTVLVDRGLKIPVASGDYRGVLWIIVEQKE